jgi:formate-dependent phosphoribosylglycinamide formyltransferase (GAR transformylase)
MKKQVAIIGLGQFGNHLARSLARMNCEVLAVDTDEKAINTLRDHVHRTVIADARDLEALQSVVTKDIDEAIVCLSKSLEASILSTLHLQQIGIKPLYSKPLAQPTSSSPNRKPHNAWPTALRTPTCSTSCRSPMSTASAKSIPPASS